MDSIELLADPAALPSLVSEILTSADGAPVPPGQVRALLSYVCRPGVTWVAAVRTGGGKRLAGALLIELPGGTGLLLVPACEINSARGELVRDALRRLTSPARPLHYYQALLEPGDRLRSGLLGGAGFTPLTQLLYLERAAVFPWVDEPRASDLAWVCMRADDEDRFAGAIRATYEDSLDCPELCTLRPLADTLAAHRGSGAFDPTLWQLCILAGTVAGCILLAPVPGDPGALEVVYVGVDANARRRGVGRLLLGRAVCLARTRHFERVTLAVDARNVPARALYDRFSFRLIARRDAWLYVPARGEVAV